MNKSDLLAWLERETQNWEALLGEIGRERMELPDVNGPWSMKDVVAHLTSWNQRHVANMRAALHGQPKPPSPWPATLENDDDVNAWIYTTNAARSLVEVLAANRDNLRQLREVVAALPDDLPIQDAYRQIQLGEQRFAVGEFFDHFHDDHEANVSAFFKLAGSPSR